MVELEKRWKSYKYKIAIFYIFIVVLVIFLSLLGFFVKFKYDRYIAKQNIISINNKQQNQSSQQVGIGNSTNKNTNANNSVANTANSNVSSQINFVCRKVLADKLTVRDSYSFKSKPVGYYTKDSVFCANDKNVNGLIQTANGWISASNTYSQIVKVNMFVDSGFHKYQDKIAKTDIEEIKVFNSNQPLNTQPTQYDANNSSTNQVLNPANQVAVETKVVEPKPFINITSEQITKEREIELKESDFKRNNKYNTAIEIAEYYYDIKDYKNAIKWALNASNAESNGKAKSGSWIIYAKSLYASGKKEQAMAVLDRYISSTQSKDAIDVLNDMKKGII